MASDELMEEIAAIDSIYPDCVIPTASKDTYVLKLPFPPNSELRLTFPDNYPDSEKPPEVRGYTPWVVEIAQQVLQREWKRDMVMYDLIEGMREILEDQGVEETVEETKDDDVEEEDKSNWERKPTALPKPNWTLPPPKWVTSDVVSEKKSVFIAWAAKVNSVEEVMHNLHHLLDSDKKVAKATHNILGRMLIMLMEPANSSPAYRIVKGNGVVIQDNDDDGEDAAGGRMGHLLSVMKAENVMVIVTRWYGGIKLGGDRFRIINSVARDAVVKLQDHR